MTAGHTDRCRELGQDVKGCHDRDRLCKSLHIAKNTAGLDLVCRDQYKYQDRPGSLRRQVCRRTPEDRDQTDQV